MDPVFISQRGLIEVTHGEALSVDSAESMLETIVKLTEQLRAADKPIYIIHDISKTNKIDKDAARLMLQGLDAFGAEKVAAFGAAPSIKSLANSVLALAGDRSSARVFETREEAEKWLLGT